MQQKIVAKARFDDNIGTSLPNKAEKQKLYAVSAALSGLDKLALRSAYYAKREFIKIGDEAQAKLKQKCLDDSVRHELITTIRESYWESNALTEFIRNM